MGGRACGFTLVETSCVLGLIGLLAAAGAGLSRPPALALAAVQSELGGALHQARHLARARGASVRVSLGNPEAGADVLGLRLPRQVRWGKPAHVPLPKGMADPVKADETGQAHGTITLSPRGTATATTWFLSQGDEVLCVRMNGQARWRMLRWRPALRAWQGVGS